MKRITIESPDNYRVGVKATGSFKAEEVIQILFSTIKFLLDDLLTHITADHPDVSEELLKGDIADMINYAASNLCNYYSPKADQASVDEHILLQCEDMILQYAQTHSISLDDAAELFNKGEIMFDLVKQINEKDRKESEAMACCGGKKKKKGKGGC